MNKNDCDMIKSAEIAVYFLQYFPQKSEEIRVIAQDTCGCRAAHFALHKRKEPMA
ncbi:MAG TPA: hypothetical protein VKB67_04800 [Rhizomicrobium sp.]|nr:hypothetical protein [Rhizomicrobium sp.]